MKKEIAIGILALSALGGSGYFAYTQPSHEEKVGATTLTEVPAIVETLVKTIPCQHVFKNVRGEIVVQEVTKADCDILATKDAPQPKMPGFTWVRSEGGVPVIATSTPTLKDGEFYIISKDTATTTAKYMIKESGKKATASTVLTSTIVAP